MTAAKKKSGLTKAKMVRSLVIVVAVAVVFGFIAKLAMDALNRKMGIDPDSTATVVDSTADIDDYEVPEMPSYEPVQTTETVSSVWTPGWETTPCSLYINSEGSPVIDSLPAAPDNSGRATELQLLMELWAENAGFVSTDIDRVWGFTSRDTCFIDFPVSPDWDGVAETIEGRFISYTRMFPFVAGELVSGYEDGISLRGIPVN
ncbi:hypothetical protein CSA37_08290 [Candidatus Fermentibacteria bacterium]|nr:MAG: hypothetical protein CSA37_08290 [Candidatus Fermentibacteria bacterium]